MKKIKQRYIGLMRDFAMGVVSPEDFVQRYLELRRETLDESDLDQDLREERIALEKRRFSEGMAAEEFSREFQRVVTELWRDRDIRPFTREEQILISDLMDAVERFHAPRNSSLPDDYSIVERQLRTIVKKALDELVRHKAE